jgi:hypothetical protein
MKVSRTRSVIYWKSIQDSGQLSKEDELEFNILNP